MTNAEIKEFIESLLEHHVYKCEVSFRKGNPIYQTILFTGFKDNSSTGVGGCWELHDNNSGTTDLTHDKWPDYIKVIEDLGELR